jgi:copper chaperone
MTHDFTIPALSCSHCERAVRQALTEADAQARVTVQLPTKHVQVQSTLPREALVASLREAGYTPS